MRDCWPRAALTGHRPADFNPAERQWTVATLDACAAALRRNHGTRVALSGMALGSDTWWAEAALTEGLDLWAYMPFEGQSARWAERDREVWRRLRRRASREVVLGQHYDVRLLFARNDLLLQDSDVLLAVLRSDKTGGGTVSAVRKARSRNHPMIRVDPVLRTVTLERGR